MKKLILPLLGLSVLIGLVMYATRAPSPVTSPAEPAPELTLYQPDASPAPVTPVTSKPQSASTASAEPADMNQNPATPVVATEATPSDAVSLNNAVDVLVSLQASYQQKQASWKYLRDAGKLDQAIVDLQWRAAEYPGTAAYPAALGQAYLQKCSVIQDVREQGILAMQADKVFDTALSLDPCNWEARFNKAVAMSFWPESLNKSQEVAEHFLILLEQQEAQAPQPQFAETYLWLGDQYKKAGQNEDARVAWQLGAALYPNHDGLRSKLAEDQ